MQHNEYDIGAAFQAIEDELIKSMIRNMDRHRAEETKEGIEWSMWQAEQLKALEKYKQENQKRYQRQFKDLNKEMGELIRIARQKGNMQQEIQILNAIRKGFPAKKISKGATAEFFRLNDRKLEALIKATTNDMQQAETAVLRMANDQYRKAIFNAQVYANSGAGTYEKAVDMATKDMLSRGLNCVEYANGARHTLSDYADMAIRTASKRAYLNGEGEKRQEWGITTVIVNKRGNPCPKCLPFVGKVLIDDVWSGGKKYDGPYPLMSKAIKAGLYHPRCKDSHTTYFPGISTADDTWTKEELESIGQANKQEAEQQHAERQHEKFERLAKYSLDEENQEKYGLKADMWKTARFKTGGMGSRKYVDSKQPLGNFHAVPKEQAVNILRRDSEEWIALLTDAEKKAVKKYTYNSGDKRPNRFFERLNAMLRGDLPDDEKLKNYAGTISGALKKRRLQYDVVCYRNASINPIGDRPPGSIVKLKQFTSTSVIPSRTLKGKCEIVIYAPKGTAGAYIEKLSSFPDQRELLLDKDCCYRVKSNQGNKIELEVLP
ncbi:MAG: phage minor capsid protein [Clostridiaceae bacterium]|nr:phage minor capsid protein [Clostridiaceae bacterium]